MYMRGLRQNAGHLRAFLPTEDTKCEGVKIEIYYKSPNQIPAKSLDHIWVNRRGVWLLVFDCLVHSGRSWTTLT